MINKAKSVRRRLKRLELDEALIALFIGAIDANRHVEREELARAHHLIWSTRRLRRKSGETVGRLIDRMKRLLEEQDPSAVMESADRQAIEHVAAEVSVPFVGVWLEAPQFTLIARAERRRDDASDANAHVFRIQQQQWTGVMTWQRVEATPSSEMVLESTAIAAQMSLHRHASAERRLRRRFRKAQRRRVKEADDAEGGFGS